MREIKFRAWVGDRMITPAVWINDSNLPGYSLGCAPSAPLMQYTGLKDVDGVEIYEGDIIEGDYFYGGRVRALVHWGEYRNGWSLGGIVSDTRRIVGNIHQNPELLEGK